jgi:hypothetical protein
MPAGLPATWLNTGWIISYLVECRLDYPVPDWLSAGLPATWLHASWITSPMVE